MACVVPNICLAGDHPAWAAWNGRAKFQCRHEDDKPAQSGQRRGECGGDQFRPACACWQDAGNEDQQSHHRSDDEGVDRHFADPPKALAAWAIPCLGVDDRSRTQTGLVGKDAARDVDTPPDLNACNSGISNLKPPVRFRPRRCRSMNARKPPSPD